MLSQVIADYLYLIRGTKYIPLPRWLEVTTTHLGPRLLPLQLVSVSLHGWMAIFLSSSSSSSSSSVASLPPGVTAYLASLLLCLSLHPAISSLMSRSAQHSKHRYKSS